jgi:4a-hydroxytetrahydrobiopterin dehydratase
MRESLDKKHCIPCEGGTSPLSRSQNLEFLQEVEQWQLIEEKSIEKIFSFKDFKEAVSFVSEVARIAEEEGHHPDISIFSWNKVKITLSTHTISGLSENDFILAAKIDRIPN